MKLSNEFKGKSVSSHIADIFAAMGEILAAPFSPYGINRVRDRRDGLTGYEVDLKNLQRDRERLWGQIRRPWSDVGVSWYTPKKPK